MSGEISSLKKDIDIDAAHVNVCIEFADKSSKLAQETPDALREQGVALMNLGSDRYVPAASITGAEAFTQGRRRAPEGRRIHPQAELPIEGGDAGKGCARRLCRS